MSTNKPLEIVVAPENVKEYISLYRSIKSLTDSNLDVPFTLIKAFFYLMQNPKNYKMDQLYEKAKNLSIIADKKLKSKKGYQFDWEDTTLKENGFVIKNDMTKVFFEMISAFFLFDKDKKADKEDAIGFFYLAFEDEYKKRIKSQDLEGFTAYKQAVISGVLAMTVGFHLTTKKTELTNEEIYQATRNAIKHARDNPKF